MQAVSTSVKSRFRLDPRTKLSLLLVINLVMVSGRLVGVEYILRIICAVIPFMLLLRNYRQITCAMI